MVQIAFCNLSHKFHKKVTNVSLQVFVILLWGFRCLLQLEGDMVFTTSSQVAIGFNVSGALMILKTHIHNFKSLCCSFLKLSSLL